MRVLICCAVASVLASVTAPSKLDKPAAEVEVETDVEIQLSGGSGLTVGKGGDSVAFVTGECTDADKGIKAEELKGDDTTAKATVKFTEMGTYNVCYKLKEKAEYTAVDGAKVTVGNQWCSKYAVHMTCSNDFEDAPNKSEMQCKGKCDTEDHVKCCKAKHPALCSTMTCPKGSHQNPAAADKKCQTLPCATDLKEDQDTCCAKNEACKDVCTGDLVIAAGKEAEFCADTKCTEAEKGTCCAKKAQCTKDICPDKSTLKPDAGKCAGAKCTEKADAETCCTVPATCNKDACGEGFVLKADKALKCKSDKCSTKTDQETCCDKQAKCSADVCGDTTLVKKDALCAGAKCDKTKDAKACCLAPAKCEASLCAKDKVLKKDAKCKGLKCDKSVDAGTCCADKAKCSTVKCLSGKPPKADAFCKGEKCVASDFAVCCPVTTNTCGAFFCGAGLVQDPAKKAETCEGDKCMAPRDNGKCCKAAPTPNDKTVAQAAKSMNLASLGAAITSRLGFLNLASPVQATSNVPSDVKTMAGDIALQFAGDDATKFATGLARHPTAVTNALQMALADVVGVDDDDVAVSGLTPAAEGRRLLDERQLAPDQNLHYCLRNCADLLPPSWVPWVCFLAGAVIAAVLALIMFHGEDSGKGNEGARNIPLTQSTQMQQYAPAGQMYTTTGQPYATAGQSYTVVGQ
mmetsp:Transcript_15355/g.37732  ORF Transcript_15355/g.37732 Transcript_15355/m.37732 type:complete len:688 (-) Transcript_15355:113-2176(-)